MTASRGRWDRYREAAVASAVEAAGEPRTGTREGTRLIGRLRARASAWWTGGPTPPAAPRGRWRDLRLVPLGAAAWLGAALGPAMEANGVGGLILACAIVCAIGAAGVASGLAVGSRRRARRPQQPGPTLRGRPLRQRSAKRRLRRHHGTPAPVIGGSVLGCCTALALAAGLAASLGHGAAERAGPVGELLARGGQTVATIEVHSEPTPLRGAGTFGSTPRFAAQGRLIHATDAGRAFSASSTVRVVGGASVQALRLGTTVEVAGRLVPAEPGRLPLLNAASRPRVVGGDSTQLLVGDLRASLRSSSQWLWPDAAGLLPGMTVGDTAMLPADLEDAMRAVGLGHLTAVSGANFTLLSGTVLLALRALRAPRPAAVACSAAALTAFAVIVGPDASVLRAAAMGAVGLVALVSGRPGRSCSSLSAAVLLLVVLEPTLALSIGFLLSVAATLGIALLGPALTEVLASRLPVWLAMAVAVPLSAQLLCGPLVVLIQPAFLSMSLAANLAVAPFVPVVTVAGTLALATCAWCPPLAFLGTAVGGACAQAVGAVARLLASVPGALLPWPEGLIGAAAMAAVSAVNAGVLWAVMLPSGRRAVADLAAALVSGARAGPGPAIGLGIAPRRGKVDG